MKLRFVEWEKKNNGLYRMGKKVMVAGPVIVAAACIALIYMVYWSFQSLTAPIFTENKSAISGKVIVLDPGHGGVDVGCGTPQGVKEKDINLDITLRVKKALESRGARVILTRSTDTALQKNGPDRHRNDLLKRAAITNRSKGQVLVSIHVNSISNSTRVRGPMVFFHPSSKAARELANQIQKRLNQIYKGAKGYSPYMHSAKRGDYLLLRSSKKPSVIVETGFITNPGDFYLLHTKQYKNNVAESIARGLDDYFSNMTAPSFQSEVAAVQEENISNSIYKPSIAKLALILTSTGTEMEAYKDVMKFSRPLAFSITPLQKESQQLNELAYQNGHEVLIDMNITGKSSNIKQYMDESYDHLSHAIGVYLHGMGKYNAISIDGIFQKARDKNIPVIGDGKAAAVSMALTGKKYGVPFLRGGDTLSSRMNADEVQREIVRAGKRAILSQNATLVIDMEKTGLRGSDLLTVLERASLELEDLGVEFVYATELIEY